MSTGINPDRSVACEAPDPGDELYAAIHANDLALSKSLLASGIAHNTVVFGALMDSCLHFVARNGRIDFINLLLDSGASIENKSITGQTPLFHALFEDHVDSFHHFVKKGASLDAKSIQGDGLLHVAIDLDAAKCTVALLDLGADLDQKGRGGVCALARAKKSKIWPVVQSYLLREEALTALDDVTLSKNQGRRC